MKAVIVGAGIGGLATAVALEQAGVDVTVLERSEQVKPGAGIAMGPNALAALEGLGAAEHVLATGNTAGGRLVLTRAGTKLTDGPWRGGIVRRTDLHDALRARLRTDVRHGARVTGVDQDAAGATVRIEGGGEEPADVVLAADGLRSSVRAQLFGDDPLIYRGSTSFRGVVRFEHPLTADRIVETWGRGQRIGLQNLGRGWTYWFTARNAPEGSFVPAADAKPMLVEQYRGWHEPIEEVLAATEESEILQTDLYDRDPLPGWVAGRVALLGDAAHPMTPDLGQGGAQAIEDAIALGDCLRGAGDVVAALREYERRRMPVAYDVLRRARRHYRLAQLENPVACGLRDTTVRRLPGAVQRVIGVRRPHWVETGEPGR